MIKGIYLALFAFSALVSLPVRAEEPAVKISLGIRDVKLLNITNVTCPLSFRIENTGETAINGGRLASIFAKGSVHLLPKGGQEQQCPIGEEWALRYGLVPNDLQPGQTTDCSVTGNVMTFFPKVKDGNYEVWWTLGEKKSNILHFMIMNGVLLLSEPAPRRAG